MPDIKLNKGEAATIAVIKRGRPQVPPLAVEGDPGLIRSPYPDLDESPYYKRPRVRLYDLATRFAQVDPTVQIGWALTLGRGQNQYADGQPDFVNGYIEMDQETTAYGRLEQQDTRADYLRGIGEDDGFDPFRYNEAVPSGRAVPNCWPLYQDSGNMFLNMKLTAPETNYTKTEVLQTGNKDWIRPLTSADRFANMTALLPAAIDPTAIAKINAAMLKLEAEGQELWMSGQSALTVRSGDRARMDAILLPEIGQANCELELVSPFYYEPFNTADVENYKCTKDPSPFAEERSLGRISATTRVRAFMVPQGWHTTVTYLAWYVIAGFLFVFYFPVSQTFTFYNRFPLFPRPMSIGTSDYPPIWKWIERTHAHGRAAAADYAFGMYGGIAFILFQFTSSGAYEIRRTDTFPNQLAAVVEFNGERRYMWRRTSSSRDLSIIVSAGPVETWHIKSWFVYTIGVPGGNYPVFPK